ncbi:hypothetical protein [Bombilactobacillus bombi]|uniref:hypothetical protein n=1 Tax=Bombilactobacillus bombi TaxID=1303590 RepID=UPI0035EB31FC
MKITNSIMNYPERGKWGNPKWRGNCSGYVIYNLLDTFKPKKFVEVFSGGGTGQAVAQDLGYQNSIHLDLVNGWDALTDEIPCASDFVFSHPPYYDIIDYNKQRGSYNPHDLSNKMPYNQFITLLDKVNENIYNSLEKGGRHAFLVGDVRKAGKYYSIIKDMTWFGDLEDHIIKIQHNTSTANKNYANRSSNPLIRITHEHLLIFRKNELWCMNIKYTKDFNADIRQLKNITWHDLIRTAMEQLGKTAYLKDLYELLEGAKKAQNNQNWQAKIRQTLEIHPDFQNIDRGKYQLIA